MVASPALQTLGLALCAAALVNGAPAQGSSPSSSSSSSVRVPLRRDHADSFTENARLAARNKSSDTSGTIPTELGRSLYWFGNFSVGDSPGLELLIDTGSSDLILNPGLYKASKNEEKYPGHKEFHIGYEGVNRAGFGFEELNGTVTLDTVSSGGLKVIHQAVGNCTSFKYEGVPQLPEPNQKNGIIGFEPKTSSSFKPQADSWFFSLCGTKAISKCILGLAYGTDGKGHLEIGDVATDLIDGELVEVPQLGKTDSFAALGDFTIDNKIFLKDQIMIMDDGTDNLQAGLESTKKIFEMLKIAPHTQKHGKGHNQETLVTGFFECNKPPTIGFSLPAQSQLKKGQKAKNFNISPDVWDVYDHGKNNCTSILGGTNFLRSTSAKHPKKEGTWLVGQPFFAGHYISFDNDAFTLSYGDLKNPKTGSA